MTRDEILNMEAGREMDDLVATKVMGWTIHPHKTHYGIPDDDRPLYYYTRMRGDFSPSYDINNAWEVVEKLGKYWIDGTAPQLGIDVEFFVDGDIGGSEKATADTVPLAICRAALLTVMEDSNAQNKI